MLFLGFNFTLAFFFFVQFVYSVHFVTRQLNTESTKPLLAFLWKGDKSGHKGEFSTEMLDMERQGLQLLSAGKLSWLVWISTCKGSSALFHVFYPPVWLFFFSFYCNYFEMIIIHSLAKFLKWLLDELCWRYSVNVVRSHLLSFALCMMFFWTKCRKGRLYRADGNCDQIGSKSTGIWSKYFLSWIFTVGE